MKREIGLPPPHIADDLEQRSAKTGAFLRPFDCRGEFSEALKADQIEESDVDPLDWG